MKTKYEEIAERTLEELQELLSPGYFKGDAALFEYERLKIDKALAALKEDRKLRRVVRVAKKS
jgi:hypothetical protein